MKPFLKVFALISFLACAFSASALTLTVGPETGSLPSFSSLEAMEADTLRILPRGGRPLEIGEYAFWNSDRLRVIEVATDAPLKIGEGAFRGCRNLEAISLPKGSTLEGQYAFSGCESLRSVELPSDLKILPPQSFSYCSDLTEISFPATLKRIGNNAFSECRALKSVSVPDGVTELESYAFSECTDMKTARLPANGALLGELIFSGCRALESLEAPSGEVPRFDCNSFIFEPDEEGLYSKCLLIVPEKSLEAYRKAPGWKLFSRIIPPPRR